MSTQARPNDLIGRYAFLSVAAENCAARGVSLPPHLRQEMQHIETMAKARMSPQQLQSAVNHIEHAKLRLRTQANELSRRVHEHDAKENTNRKVKEMTAGMFGQPGGANKAQLDAYLSGQPIPSQGGHKPTPAQLDAAFRSYTRQTDPKGVGWGKKETERRMDELVDASPAEFERIVKREGYRKDPRQLREAASKWSGERIEQGLIERRTERSRIRNGEPEEKELVPNDRDKRRAVLVQSYLDTTADQIEEDTSNRKFSEVADDFADRMPASATEEPGRRGALARAWNEQLEFRED